MGTGISRLNMLMSCGPFQPLGRRIDEMRKMGSTKLDHGTPSTKMLLNNNNNDQEDAGVSVDSSNGTDAGGQSIFNISSSRKNDLFVVVDSTKDRERGSTLEPEEDKGGDHNICIINNKHEEDEEEEGGRSSDYEGLLWIRSPSFRDYCVDHSDDDDSLKNVNGGKINGEKRENQTQAADGADNEVCMIRQGPKTDLTSASKGWRETRFRKLVFSHRTGGMKNLLKVKNCNKPKVPHSGPGKPPGKSS